MLKILSILVIVVLLMYFSTIRAKKKIKSEYIIGAPIQNIFWGLFIFGSPILFLYGLSSFQPLNFLKVSIYLITIPYIFALVYILIRRNTIIPWGNDYPFLKFMAIIGAPVVFAMFIYGSFLTINGLFDKSEALILEATVAGKRLSGGERPVPYIALRLVADSQVKLEEVSVNEVVYNSKNIGSKVKVKTKLGFLGVRWIEGYEL